LLWSNTGVILIHIFWELALLFLHTNPIHLSLIPPLSSPTQTPKKKEKKKVEESAPDGPTNRLKCSEANRLDQKAPGEVFFLPLFEDDIVEWE
jgi:hypothetical protein